MAQKRTDLGISPSPLCRCRQKQQLTSKAWLKGLSERDG